MLRTYTSSAGLLAVQACPVPRSLQGHWDSIPPLPRRRLLCCHQPIATASTMPPPKDNAGPQAACVPSTFRVEAMRGVQRALVRWCSA